MRPPLAAPARLSARAPAPTGALGQQPRLAAFEFCVLTAHNQRKREGRRRKPGNLCEMGLVQVGTGPKGGRGAQPGAAAPLTCPCESGSTSHRPLRAFPHCPPPCSFCIFQWAGRPRRRPRPSAHFHHQLIARPIGPVYSSGRSQRKTDKKKKNGICRGTPQ